MSVILSSSEYTRRLGDFQNAYEWEETDAIARSFIHVGELVEVAFDATTAARAMHALALIVRTPAHMPIAWSSLSDEAPANWAETWREMDGYNDTNWSWLLEGAHNLHAFAFFGILPSQALEEANRHGGDFPDVPTYVHHVVKQLQRFVQMLPKNVDVAGIDLIDRLCLASEARLKVDADEPLTVHELAALSQVTTKRLQNAMYAKSSDAPVSDHNGLIPVVSAMRWLESRSYLRSLWNDPDADAPQDVAHVEEEDDFLFVPEAKDGTIFSPSFCLRGGENGVKRYTVGAKDDETDFDKFEDALAALTRMKTPRWRRPTNAGIFSIVSAERWRRVSRSELEAL